MTRRKRVIMAKPRGHFAYNLVTIMLDGHDEPVKHPDNAVTLYVEVPQEMGGVEVLPFPREVCEVKTGWLH